MLDKYEQVVPVGVPGEICVGGDGLGRGYLNRPDEESERFFSCDVTPERTTRLYRTGDIGCWRTDGNLLYLGRSDHQVKVRGYRIELGEIEASLTKHPDVTEAVVTVLQDGEEDARLVAYCQSSTASPPDAGDLRQYLSKVLPVYMIPSFFVGLDAFPLTPSGKVDRLGLPQPQVIDSEIDLRVEPRTPTEKRVAAIWVELLDVNECCVHDNFFEVGGHSLLATRLVSRLRQIFAVDLPLLSFFENPTIASLSERLVALQLDDLGEEGLELMLRDMEETGGIQTESGHKA